MDHVYEMEIEETLRQYIYSCFALFVNHTNTVSLEFKKRTAQQSMVHNKIVCKSQIFFDIDYPLAGIATSKLCDMSVLFR